MTEKQKKPMNWEALATTKAQAFGLPVEDVKREVQRELTVRLAQDIVDHVFRDLNAGPFAV